MFKNKKNSISKYLKTFLFCWYLKQKRNETKFFLRGGGKNEMFDHKKNETLTSLLPGVGPGPVLDLAVSVILLQGRDWFCNIHTRTVCDTARLTQRYQNYLVESTVKQQLLFYKSSRNIMQIFKSRKFPQIQNSIRNYFCLIIRDPANFI